MWEMGVQAPMTALCILTILIGKDAINLRERHWHARPVARCGRINSVINARESRSPTRDCQITLGVCPATAAFALVHAYPVHGAWKAQHPRFSGLREWCHRSQVTLRIYVT